MYISYTESSEELCRLYPFEFRFSSYAILNRIRSSREIIYKASVEYIEIRRIREANKKAECDYKYILTRSVIEELLKQCIV